MEKQSKAEALIREEHWHEEVLFYVQANHRGSDRAPGTRTHGRANGPFVGEVGPAGKGKVPPEETRNGGQIEGGMAEDKGAHIEE